MSVIFVQEGDFIDYTPVADVAPGDVVIQGDLAGVAKRPIPAGTLGALAVEGLFDFPKTPGTGTAIPVGTRVYWDVAEKVAKADDEAGANKSLGKTTAAAGDSDETVRVRLSQYGRNGLRSSGVQGFRIAWTAGNPDLNP